MVTPWVLADARGSRCWVRVGVTSASLHEGIKRVFVAVVPAGRRFPVGCALGRVGCGFPGFRLSAGSRWASWWRLSRCAWVNVMRRGRGGGGTRATRGLRPVGGWWGEAGGMLGARHWFVRSRTRLASVWCLVASGCRHVWRAGTLVFWLVRPPARYFRVGWSPGG